MARSNHSPKRTTHTLARRDHDHITRSLRDAHSLLSSSRRSSSDSLTAKLRRAFGVAAGAGVTGVIVGRLGHWNWPGTPIPVGLSLGLGVIGADALGWIPDAIAPDAVNGGIGAIAAWTTMLGAGWGRQMAASAGAAVDQPITAGARAFAPPANFGQLPQAQRRMTEAELAAYMRAAA